MTNNRFQILAAASAISLGGCAAGPAPEQSSVVIADDCPVLEATDFVAWINKMPGTKSATLHVTGKLTLPSSGYSAKLNTGILDRRFPPTQRLNLEVVPPAGPAAQVLTTIEVKSEFPAASSRYRAVTIQCGAQTLAEITQVEEVH